MRFPHVSPTLHRGHRGSSCFVPRESSVGITNYVLAGFLSIHTTSLARWNDKKPNQPQRSSLERLTHLRTNSALTSGLACAGIPVARMGSTVHGVRHKVGKPRTAASRGGARRRQDTADISPHATDLILSSISSLGPSHPVSTFLPLRALQADDGSAHVTNA